MGNCITLKKSNCKNCYKCIRNCPVKSIRFSGNQAHIIEEDCILCGQCFVVCPQNAKEISDETEKIKVMLQGAPVYVSIAPSFVANYPGVGIESMNKALVALGFAGAEETAIGAHIVKKEYERMLAEENHDIVISSCCHSVNLLIQKYFPSCLDYLAPVLSPMQAHCKDIKKRYPNAKTVFIGPCVAKKDEAQRYPEYVDAVLTFEDLTRWFNQEGITLEKNIESNEKSRARLFPTSGGILKTMECKEDKYTYLVVDGTFNCIETLKDIEAGKLHNCFIEMSSCQGSCIGGPIIEKNHHSVSADYVRVSQYAGKKDFDVASVNKDALSKNFRMIIRNEKTPTDEEIKNVLRQMGKTKLADELNCGSCGYPSCKDKAIAVFQGKAEISMCLPFLKDKAESFSDIVADNSPNGLIVLNDNLEIQQINAAARDIMHIRQASDVLGDQVINILDPKPFRDVLETGRNVKNKKKYLAEYRRYVEESIIYDREYHVLLCIMRDISDEEFEKKNKEMISQQTIEIADRVVDKQMRIVQEIASLLGETAAETKIALTKLKESITNE